MRKPLHLIPLAGLLMLALLPAGASDRRLDTKITISAGNVMLHDVIEELSEQSGVAIFCGETPEDYRVRDVPMVVAAKGLRLGKVLEYIAFSTHTLLTSTQAEGADPVYRLVMDPEFVKARDEDAKAQAEYGTAHFKWILAQAPKLKSPMARLVAALDQQTKDLLLTGEPVIYHLRTAPEKLRAPLLGFFRELDEKKRVEEAEDFNNYTDENKQKKITPADVAQASPEDLENASVKIMRMRDGIQVYACIPVKKLGFSRTSLDWAWQELPDQGSKVDRSEAPTYAELKTQPPKGRYRELDLQWGDLSPGPTTLKEFGWNTPQLARCISLKYDKSRKLVSEADVLLDISRMTGMAIVCEDLRSAAYDDVNREGLAYGFPLASCIRDDCLCSVYIDTRLMYDDETKALIAWKRYDHRNLIPDRIIQNIATKAKAGGAGLDDLTPLAAFSESSVSQWMNSYRFRGLPRFNEVDRPMWALYDSLSPADRALANTNAGLPLAKQDIKPVQDWLKQRVRLSYKEVYDGVKPVETRLLDPTVLPSLVLRIRTGKDKYYGQSAEKLPTCLANRQIYTLYIEGTDGKEKISVEAGGIGSLPYFDPDREAALKRAAK